MHTHGTVDWFTDHADVWLRVFGHLVGKEVEGLEVGSFEGVSARWMMDNILTNQESRLTCIDPWDGKDPCLGARTIKAEASFDANLEPFKGRVIKRKETSWDGLTMVAALGHTYDLIFIDGDHEAQGALCDLVLSWPLLKVGGILAFDDHDITPLKGLRHQPREAWDAFFSLRDDFEEIPPLKPCRQKFTRKTK